MDDAPPWPIVNRSQEPPDGSDRVVGPTFVSCGREKFVHRFRDEEGGIVLRLDDSRVLRPRGERAFDVGRRKSPLSHPGVARLKETKRNDLVDRGPIRGVEIHTKGAVLLDETSHSRGGGGGALWRRSAQNLLR